MTPIARWSRRPSSSGSPVRTAKSPASASWKKVSQLPAKPGRTPLRSAGPPPPDAPATVPPHAANPPRSARPGAADGRGVGVGLTVVLGAELVEARERLPCTRRRLGIDLAQVANDRLDGRVEAVQVEAVEPGGPGRAPVPLAEPRDEVEHD